MIETVIKIQHILGGRWFWGFPDQDYYISKKKMIPRKEPDMKTYCTKFSSRRNQQKLKC
jgi:hypothetical protein